MDYIPSQNERIVFSQRNPLDDSEEASLVESSSGIKFIQTIKKLKDEYIFFLPRLAIPWVVEVIFRSLAPAKDGGFPDDEMGHGKEIDGVMVRIRRTPNCGAPDEMGFTIIICAKDNERIAGRFPTIQLNDRLLFDSGLYRVLHSVYTRTEGINPFGRFAALAATIRPNWMGSTPAETPPIRA